MYQRGDNIYSGAISTGKRYRWRRRRRGWHSPGDMKNIREESEQRRRCSYPSVRQRHAEPHSERQLAAFTAGPAPLDNGVAARTAIRSVSYFILAVKPFDSSAAATVPTPFRLRHPTPPACCQHSLPHPACCASPRCNHKPASHHPHYHHPTPLPRARTMATYHAALTCYTTRSAARAAHRAAHHTFPFVRGMNDTA